ncbi:MAG: 2-hydroxyacyl-CoA dehydratase [Promethearchaeota archaeon]
MIQTGVCIDMNLMADDIVQYKSLLRLSVEFLNGREKLKKLKLREHKHLIGTVFPPVEFAFAAGAYPVFSIRMQKFGQLNQQIINAIFNFSKLLGWQNFSKALRLFKKFDSRNILENLINDTIDKINNQYNRLRDLTDPLGIPSDSCYGIRAIYGMNAEKGKNLSANLNFSIRCSSFEKMYESTQKFVNKGLFVNVPLRDTDKGKKMLIQDLYNLAEQLEIITGKSITNNSLRKICETTNECKDYSFKIIHDIALGDTYPCSPVTISEFLLLIEMSFMDYLSDAELFADILKDIYNEMKSRRWNSEFSINVKNRSKILFIPRFGGSDPIAHEYVYEGGGRVIYADWEVLGYLSKIKTTGDMFENYADYLMNTISGLGVNNEEHSDNILKFCLENGIDGVIYNQLFGCHSLTTSFSVLRKKLIQNDIPSTLINFNSIGENRGQVKTRIEALMELLK